MSSQNNPLKSFSLIFSKDIGGKIYPLNNLMAQSGNIKIPSTTAIFNLSSATDCPSRKLGLCKAAKKGVKCYALKSEYIYHPNVLPYRRRQESFWKSNTAEQFASQFILINSLKKKPFTSLRFNESGDFHSQECVDKAEKIAMILKKFGVKTYCYTSRSDLSFKSCKNLIVSGSGFRKKGIHNEFRIIFSLQERPKGFGMCCGNCRICDRCQTRGKLTCVIKH